MSFVSRLSQAMDGVVHDGTYGQLLAHPLTRRAWVILSAGHHPAGGHSSPSTIAARLAAVPELSLIEIVTERLPSTEVTELAAAYAADGRADDAPVTADPYRGIWRAPDAETGGWELVPYTAGTQDTPAPLGEDWMEVDWPQGHRWVRVGGDPWLSVGDIALPAFDPEQPLALPDRLDVDWVEVALAPGYDAQALTASTPWGGQSQVDADWLSIDGVFDAATLTRVLEAAQPYLTAPLTFTGQPRGRDAGQAVRTVTVPTA